MPKKKTPSKRKTANKPKKAVLASKSLEQREKKIREIFDIYNAKIRELKRRKQEIIKDFARKAGQKKIDLIRKKIGLK
jgi:hypothetical protein